MFLHVAGDFVFELCDELWPLRARADDGHFAFEDVPELGQLINAEAPQPAAKRDGRFFARAAPGRAALFVAGRHGAEFQDVKDFAVPADARLAVEHWAARAPAYPQGDGGEQRREEDEGDAGDDFVFQPFGQAFAPVHRRDADVERVVADNVGALVVDEAEAAQVGDVADVGGAVAQDVEDVTNGVTGGQWQADPYFVAGRFAVARRVVAAHVFDVVKQRFVGIKQADLPHDKARQRVAADGAEDFAAGGVVADEGEAACVVSGGAQAAE